MATSTLDALLGALSVEIEAFAVCEIGEDVRLIIPPVDMIEVHHVLEGKLHLTIDDRDIVEVGPGSTLVVPPGRKQYLATSPGAVTSKDSLDIGVPVRDGMLVVDATDGKKPALRIACGAVMPDAGGSYGPLDNLMRPVAENLSDVPVVAAAFDALLEEVAAPTDGTRALTGALMKTCLVVLLRRHLQASRAQGTTLALFDDDRLGRAVAAILDRPAADHSVTSLAREAGMSRSGFARGFKEALNLTPMEFVARSRLSLAHRLLVTTGIPVEGVASMVGFSSRSHFSRLFRGHYGADPSSVRRNGREAA